MMCFAKLEKSILKYGVGVGHKRLLIVRTILSRENTAGDFTALDLTLYYRAIVTKTTQYCHENRHSDME